MKRVLRLAVLMMVFGVAAAQTLPAPAETKRSKLPPAAEQQKTLKEIQEVYKAEYADRRPDAKITLAGKMLTQGDDSKDANAARYLLYRESARLAASAGDVNGAIRALDQLDAAYESDGGACRLETLDLAATVAKADGQIMLAEAFVGLADRAIEDENFVPASRLLVKAQTCARAGQDLPLANEIQKRSAGVTLLQADLPKIADARRVLEKTPTDAVACGLVGRFTALGKGDWAAGLPLLAQGDQKLVAEVAARELALQNDLLADPAKVAAIADGWWDLAESLTGAPQLAIHHHAAAMYEGVVSQLEGFQKKKAEGRIASLTIRPVVAFNAAQLPRILVNTTWYYSFERGPGRVMRFGANNRIVAGANDHEFAWRFTGDVLEFLRPTGVLKRRMVYDPARNYWTHIPIPGDDMATNKAYLLPVISLSQQSLTPRDREVLKRFQTGEWDFTAGPTTKRLTFGPDNVVGKGASENERRYRVTAGKLEFIHANGCVCSRFVYSLKAQAWLADPKEQPDTLYSMLRTPLSCTLKAVPAR